MSGGDDHERWLVAVFCAVVATYLLIVLAAGAACLVYAREFVANPDLVCDKRDRIMEMLGLVMATVVALIQRHRGGPGGGPPS